MPSRNKNYKKEVTYLMPFGGGHNLCPGQQFAINEMVLFTKFLLEKFDVKLINTKKWKDLKLFRNRASFEIPVDKIPFSIRKK